MQKNKNKKIVNEQKEDTQDFISLLNYLESLTDNELKELYFRVVDKNIHQKSRKALIEKFYAKKVADYYFNTALRIDCSYKEVDDIINGKQPKKVSKELLDELFVVCIDGVYTIFSEYKDAYQINQTKETMEEKKKRTFEFYINANGVIAISKLSELMNKTGFVVTEKETKEWCQKLDYYIKDNLVYASSLAIELNAHNELIDIKNEIEYQIFDYNEIISQLITNDMSGIEGEIEKIISKKVKNNNANEVIGIVLEIAKSTIDYEEEVKKYLEMKNIKLGKDEKKFFEVLESYNFLNPNWILNGASLSDMAIASDYDDAFERKDERNLLEMDPDITKNDAINLCINAYLCINGIIEIDKLFNIIKQYHYEKVTKSDLIKYVKKDECFEIVDDYIIISSLPDDIREMLISAKKKHDYHVLEDFDIDVDEALGSEDDELGEILAKYDISQGYGPDIASIMNLGLFNEMFLGAFLEQNAICLSEKTLKKLYDELKKYISNKRLWYLNGFMPCEINTISKRDKVGRNDPCPCGSGKKYKKCCGK